MIVINFFSVDFQKIQFFREKIIIRGWTDFEKLKTHVFNNIFVHKPIKKKKFLISIFLHI